VPLSTELDVAVRAARAAGDVALRYYQRDRAVDRKADDTPVTRADLEANDAILAILGEAFPDDAILSEEGAPDMRGVPAAGRVWHVDPLDGTRDFVAGTGEFCVHVGLAVDGRAVLGVVYQPVAGILCYAHQGGGAWQVADGRKARLQVSAHANARTVGISRLAASERLVRGLAEHGLQACRMGASTKHLRLAAGGLDAVVNLTPEYAWDTCAPEVIVREAGGAFTDVDGAPFHYREPRHARGTIASNRACHAPLVELARSWRA